MKAVVNDKKNLTFVSHLNGVTIVESSGFIIDLDYQCLTSICEIFDIGNNYSIVESNRISELENALTESELIKLSVLFDISIIYFYTCIRIKRL